VTHALQHLQKGPRTSGAPLASTSAVSLHQYLGRRLTLVFGLLLLAILGNGLLMLHNFHTLDDSERTVSHTHAVKAEIAVMETLLVDAESAQEGYLLTGDRSYLAPYVSARSTIDAEVAQLRALTAHDTTEQAHIASLKSQVTVLLAELQQTIDLRAQQRTDEALAMLRAGKGHQTMESIRALLEEMDAREARLLNEQPRMAEDDLTAAHVTILLATLANVLLLAALFALVSRTFAARERYLRAERAARAAAETAVAQRDQFLSIASHELRTPLTVLLGNIQLLERRLSRMGVSDVRLHQSFAAIHRQLARLQALVNAMLDVSRIERGQLKIAREPLDFAALVREVVDEVQPTAPAHPIEQVISPDTSGAILVPGDELRLEQVVLNLLQNAIKYSPDGGPIRVEVTRAADHVSLSVSDRGQGILEEALPHLFERFYRAPDVRSEHISGMGIGLYIVSEIVAMHGGTVTVVSEQGVGSTFTVHLPLVTPAESVPSKGMSSNDLPATNEPK
jgi:signal transduction histidine kinase